MRAITLTFGLGAALAFAVDPTVACPGGDHSHEDRRAEPQVPLTPPAHPLVWGDVNIIHTTDSHGWLLGHQKSSFPEPNYRCVHPTTLERLEALLTCSQVVISVILRPLWRA